MSGSMKSDNPSPNRRGGTDKSTVLEHDVAETLYAGTDHVARCPECDRETLWADREFLTHADDCPYWEVERR